jgi:hypothetical protein
MIERTLEAARRELDLAEAELAVLKQEMVLRHLIDTGEPTEEARTVLARLRDVATKLSEVRRHPDGGLIDAAA